MPFKLRNNFKKRTEDISVEENNDSENNENNENNNLNRENPDQQAPSPV
jgi:hypothetical protein